MREKVILGMSGGVDSAVSAYLLQKQGYEVIAIHFAVQDNEKAKKELADCQEIARTLNIELHSFLLEKEFQELVISPYLEEIKSGRTPSPCPLCDEKIKFHLLFRQAEKYEAKYVATGHYAKIEYVKEWERFLLKQEHFIQKDQCYMLYRLSPEKLSRILFPLSEIEKSQVREIAKEIGLSVAEKKDSQGICFAPEGYQAFLKKHLSEQMQEGNFIDEKGSILGKHQGYPLYTVGQRRGLGIQSKEVFFITKIDVEKNEITLGKYEKLFQKKVELKEAVFHLPRNVVKNLTLLGRARFSSTGFYGRIEEENGKIYFCYEEENAHNAPGQHLVLFYHSYVIGGGIIQ